MVGASREALRRYQVSSLIAWMEVNIARNWGVARVSQGRGDEPYKLRWSSELQSNFRLIMGRDLFFWSLYAGYHGLRSKAKRYVHSHGTPTWVRSVLNRYRVLRQAARRYM
jgi:hypothetical protein